MGKNREGVEKKQTSFKIEPNGANDRKGIFPNILFRAMSLYFGEIRG